MSGIRFGGITAALVLLAFTSPPVFGQFSEIEPNQPCAAAQDLVADSQYLPLDIQGEITRDDPTTSQLDGDTDFFSFEAPPGTPLHAQIVEHETTWWPSFDPVVGLFDKDCNYLSDTTWSPDGDDKPGIDFVVPAGGRFTLGVSAGNDGGIWGHHFQAGFYTLRLEQAPESITGIRGRVVDAATGYPLGPAWFLSEWYASQDDLWVWIDLYRCENSDCEEPVNVPATQHQRVNPTDGTFTFLIDDSRAGLLDPGYYQLKVDAIDYADTFVAPVEVRFGEIVDIGDIELTPPPLVFKSYVACNGPLAIGAGCRYSVEVTNTTESDVRVRVWSLIEGQVKPGYVFTKFPALPRFRVAELGPLSTKMLHFSFYVPTFVPDQFKSMCLDTWASNDESGFLGLLRHNNLFCIVRRGGMFEVTPIAASYAGVAVRWWSEDTTAGPAMPGGGQ